MVEGSILLLEDDFILQDIVNEYLKEHSYKVRVCSNYDEASDALYEESFDLLILDVKIDGGDGFKLLRQSRDSGIKTPAIFMTSLDSIDDLQKGYESGCNDYLRKPFELKELLFRIQALIKRDKIPTNEPTQIRKDIFLDHNKQQLQTPQTTFELSAKEYKLLNIFIENRDRLLSHESLFEKLWSWDEEPSEMSLRAYIKTLRKMIGNDAIKTFRGSGYRFESS